MEDRGWGWTASKIRQARLIEWLAPQSSSVTACVPVKPFYDAQPDQEAVTIQVIHDDLRNLEQRSLLDLAAGIGGIDSCDARATVEGRRFAEELKARRADRRLRKAACRNAMVDWLYTRDATSPLRQLARNEMLSDPCWGTWLAEQFSEDDLDTAAGWLNRHRLVDGVTAWGREGPVRLHLTDAGVTCAEEFSSDTARFVAAQPPNGTSPAVDRSAGVQIGSGNVQVNHFYGNPARVVGDGSPKTESFPRQFQGGVPAPRVADANPLALGVHRARSIKGDYSLLPPYINRDIDYELRGRLTAASEHGGWILLIGDSTSGKSRAAFEAMRQVLADYRVITPSRDADLTDLTQLIDMSEDRYLLWLDDMQSYLRPRGFDEALLSALIRRGVVILATLRSDIYESLRRNLQSSIAKGNGMTHAAVLNMVEPVEIARQWSPGELSRAARESDERLKDAVSNHGTHGIAEYLAAGPELSTEWNQASRVGGHPRGAALVSTAVDLARIGLDGPVHERLLKRAHQDYLDRAGGASLRPESFADALKWAAQVRYGATSLLIPGNTKHTWRAFDYLIGEKSRDPSAEQVPEATWRSALAYDLSSAQRFSIGVAAYCEARNRDFAEAAWLPLAEAGEVWAMYNLGCMYARTEEITPLVEWFGGGSAIFMAQAEHAGNAEVWWRRAAENGHVDSMYNLGTLLLGLEGPEEAEKWLDQAEAREAERRAPNAIEDHGQWKSLRETARRLRSIVEPGE